jgi:uncharacterized cupredoxin-like copper-binding protein
MPNPVTAVTRALFGAAALGAVLSACGSDDGTSSGTDTENVDLTVVALDSNDFDEDAYTAQSSDVTVEYEQGGNLRHTLLVEEVEDFALEVTAAGDVDVGTVELSPGEYTIFCDVPGHREAGMEATLTVE